MCVEDRGEKIKKQRTVMNVDAWASWGAAVLRPYTEDSAVMMSSCDLLIGISGERIRKKQIEVEVGAWASWGAAG
jgi:hypothetical protein